jgi:hypothetical protein
VNYQKPGGHDKQKAENVDFFRAEGIRNFPNGICQPTEGIRNFPNGTCQLTEGIRNFPNGTCQPTEGIRNFPNGNLRWK